MENEILTSEIKGSRTLATVLFTDCVGFSARMSVNEEHTLDLIRRDLKLMTKICDAFDGRVLKSTGDGLLVCFSSAVKAVEGAIAIQRKIAEGLQTLPPSDSLMHRIGIHLADMYITPTDVMGNGVNIAARLQTEAEPGGICISQTVYDVAKNALQLEVDYLGPRELKNIREVVPVYRIILDNENSVQDPYAETVRLLEQSGNGARIRKLIFYVCKNHWETDETKLANLSLKGIIHEFLGLASSYEQVRALLNGAVGTLSKQSEYTLVANEILKGVTKFYPPEQTLHMWQGQLGATSSDQAMPTGIVTNVAQSRYQQIAQRLEQHPDALRMKKLLYYIVRREWAGDTGRLQLVNTTQLLTEMSVLANSPHQLADVVNRFVQTLNKQAEYAVVATTLMDFLSQLYGKPSANAIAVTVPPDDLATAFESATPSPSASPQTNAQQQTVAAIAAQLEQHPHYQRIKKILIYLCHAQWVQSPDQLGHFQTTALLQVLPQRLPDIPSVQQAALKLIKSLSKQAEYSVLAQLLIQAIRPLYPAAAIPPVSASAAPQVAEPVAHAAATAQGATALDTPTPVTSQPLSGGGTAIADPATPTHQSNGRTAVDMFDIRLGILKYTNPLKAKILAFSALHTDFDFTHQDWFNLKTHDLDSLLRGLIQTCQNYTDLEYLLYSTAKRLAQPDELIQTADTVTKYLRSYYLHGNPAVLTGVSSTDETRISLDDFEVATQEIAAIDEDDQTRGLPPALPHPPQLGVSSPDSGLSTRLIFATEQDSLMEG